MIDFSKFPYPEMREHQKTVLEKINQNWDKPNILIEAPTGFGKSAVAKTICSSFNNAYLITATKQLQDQYIEEFANDEEFVSIKGKNNYKCNLRKGSNCDTGPCLMSKMVYEECKIFDKCEYIKAKDTAENSKIMLTSYQYFLKLLENPKNFVRDMSRDVIIFDECHLMENFIVQWASIKLFPQELQYKFNLLNDVSCNDLTAFTNSPMRGSRFVSEVEQWLNKIYYLVNNRIKSNNKLMNAGVSFNNHEDYMINRFKKNMELKDMKRRLELFLNDEDKNNWVIEPSPQGILIIPLHAAPLFHRFIKKMAKQKIVFMSATIIQPESFCYQMGLKQSDTLIIQLGSSFHPKLSPIVYKPVGYTGLKNLNNTLEEMVSVIKEILEKHKDQKGIIHTGNYAVAEYIYKSINSDRLLLRNEELNNNEKLIKAHITTNKPTVLISPSLAMGVDLKDDLSRFQIIIKMPWLYLDTRVKRKIASAPNWYPVEMVKTLIQSCGRSTRSETDWSVTYILDKSFYRWVHKYKEFLDPHFLQRILWDTKKHKKEMEKEGF